MSYMAETRSNVARNLALLVDVPKRREFVTQRWLRRAVAERRLGYFKLGGRVLIDLDELDTLIERGRVDPRSP